MGIPKAITGFVTGVLIVARILFIVDTTVVIVFTVLSDVGKVFHAIMSTTAKRNNDDKCCLWITSNISIQHVEKVIVQFTIIFL